MIGVVAAWLALWSGIGAPEGAPGLRLTRIEAQPAVVHANLLPNPGFEEAAPGGIPVGWTWDPRNTNASCALDRQVAHSGSYSVRITNGTPYGAHVYGSLWATRPIPLQAGKQYTFSAWVRSERPGMAWIGGGHAWQFRLGVPVTGKLWQRIALTFTPGPDDVLFQPRINTDSPTPGFWIDDVKLEEGDATPMVPPPGVPAGLQIAPEAPRMELEGDGVFHVGFSVYVPEGWQGTGLTAQMQGASPMSVSARLTPGAWEVRVYGQAIAQFGDWHALTLTVAAGDVQGSGSVMVRFLSQSGAQRRLEVLAAQLPAIERRLQALKRRGWDVAYPRVSVTVLQRFVGYVAEDLSGAGGRYKPEVKRALSQLDDLEPIAARLKQLLASGCRFPAVPRWTGTVRPHIEGPSFMGEARVHSRIVRRPLFFTGYGAFGQVRADVPIFPAYGINIIQIEVGPSAVFPSPNTVDLAPVRDVQRVLAAARKAGVAVNLLISPHYMPDWFLQQHPALRVRREGFLQYCLHAPEGQDLLKRFIGIVIPAVKNFSSLHSICLSNEPVNLEAPCAPGRALWITWLRKRHGSVDALNQCWGTHYRTFDEIPLPDPFGPIAGPMRADYVRWNQEFFAGWHRMLADEVHRYAPHLPVHAKAMTWTFFNDGDVKYGVDAGLFGQFSQINGNDSVNFPDPPDGEFAQGWQLNAMGYDLQRSVLNAPVFNSENHLIPDRYASYVDPQHIRAALWQAAVHGQSATTLWVWERTFDPKSDFAGSIMHRPACAEAVGLVNCDLNRAAWEVTALQRAQPDVWILQSVSAAVWDGAAYTDCLNKLYQALDLAGLKVGFVTERQLEAGTLPHGPLFIPNIHHLSDKAFATLRSADVPLYAVGDGPIGDHDEYDRPRADRLRVVPVPYGYPGTSARDLWGRILEMHIGPSRPEALDAGSALPSRQPAWGVELRWARVAHGAVINLFNTLRRPIRIILADTSGGAGANNHSSLQVRTVLDGRPIRGAITLKPLDTLLVKWIPSGRPGFSSAGRGRRTVRRTGQDRRGGVVRRGRAPKGSPQV
ncbi:MAG: beta-galactosidase [Chthonomonadales bacterium]